MHEIVGRVEVGPLDEPYVLLGRLGSSDEETILLGGLFGVFEGEGSVGMRIDEIIVATRVYHNIINPMFFDFFFIISNPYNDKCLLFAVAVCK